MCQTSGGVLQSEWSPMIFPKLREKMSTFAGCASNIYLEEEVSKMSKTLHRVLLFAGLLAVSTGLWLVAQQGGRSNLITQEQAREQALRFLAVCELPAPRNKPMVRLKEPAGLPVWQLKWPDLYTVEVNGRTGAVVWFKNYAREYERVKGINRNRPSRFTSRQEMEQYIWQIARRLGLPKDAYLKHFKVHEEGDPRIADANRAGAIVATFDTRPFGYSFLREAPEGGAFGLTVDIVDGVVVGFSRALDVMVESHVVRFPKEQAIARAKDTYEKWYRTHSGPHRGKYSDKVELGYVIPNGMFGGKRYPRQVPLRARLAWAVYFGNESVWIDAADGSILGGVILK